MNRVLAQPLPAHGLDVIALWLAAFLCLAGCSKTSAPHTLAGASEQVVPVTVAVALASNVPVQLNAVGHVTAFSSVLVRSRVDGVLEQVHLQQGDVIKQGELIFTIDPRPFQAALDQAKANLERDKATAKYGELQARRNAELFRQGIIPQDTNDQSRANADALEAAVVADEAAVVNAQLELSYCYIRSPLNGRAGVLLVNAGNAVKNLDTVLITLNQTKPIYVDFPVPEQQLPIVREHLAECGKLPVTASVPIHEQPSSSGELTILNNAVDPTTGTILLRAVFDNGEEHLWPGQFVNIALTLTTLTNAVVVPSQAVQTGQQGDYVFVVRLDATVEARPVEVGLRGTTQMTVTKGVLAGEMVVTEGQIRLAPGIKVRVNLPTPSQGTPQGSTAGSGPSTGQSGVRGRLQALQPHRNVPAPLGRP